MKNRRASLGLSILAGSLSFVGGTPIGKQGLAGVQLWAVLAKDRPAVRTMMLDGNPVGRKFDFLCQEFNREANTLCSKATDIELTRCGLALKSAVEQLREQVQNIE